MRTSHLASLAVLVATGTARADIDDEKPWDWKSLESSMLRNEQGNGNCDAIAHESEHPKIVCTVDHKSWDDHLKKELKIERIRDRNHQQPSSCDGGGFLFFRPTTSNGGFPTQSGAAPVLAEFRAKVATLTCRFDDVDKDPWVTYDAKTRTIVIHITRNQMWNPYWIQDELRTDAMQKAFPALNKYWRAHS
jgi:hypothetical protein